MVRIKLSVRIGDETVVISKNRQFSVKTRMQLDKDRYSLLLKILALYQKGPKLNKTTLTKIAAIGYILIPIPMF